VTINGTVNARGVGATPGAGGNQSCASAGNGSNGQSDSGSDSGAGGGGGAGFGAAGATAGTGIRNLGNGGSGGGGGAASGAAALSPLRGGCKGGNGGNGNGTGGAGGAGGGAPFMAYAPCADETFYVAGSTIAFGGSVGFDYAPRCLKVPAGTTVTFSGDFATHPLIPSAIRGTITGNPIVATSSGATATFTFANPGFYAYLCMIHGLDDGSSMSGVIWVQ
jgi:plastocyanin